MQQSSSLSRVQPAALTLMLALLPGWMPAVALAASVSFNRDIRPILSDHCSACHGPDEKARKGGLRLDQEEASRRTLKSGKTAIVPGRLDASELVARITTSDPDDRMPPAETKKPLTQESIELLKRWISEGAKYEGHWAYLTPQHPELPEVKDTGWPRNDLDPFVLARLEKDGLAPAPEAPKEKLLRRVTLDLTGLPPTAEEIDAFLADSDGKAYDKVVDRLLDSPHYGEGMAQQWLDLARYGETQGYHHDRHRDLWHWRDWVIRAFNENMPFDRFTTEQLAGDLLPDPTRDQLIATGFHRNEMTTSEGGALPEEYIVKYAVGRVDTTARVWLGTSLACAECHDHKYDPILQKDYYQFFAFFFDTPEKGLDAEELNPSPRITLETPDQRTRAEQLDREVLALEAAEKLVLSAPQPDWDPAQAAWEDSHRRQSVAGWQPLKLSSARVTRAGELQQRGDGSIALDRGAGGATAYDLTFESDPGFLNGLRLEALPDDRLPGKVAEPSVESAFLLSGIEVEVRSRNPTREVYPDDSPVAGAWSSVGPFGAGSQRKAFDREFGPEKGFDAAATFNEGKLKWTERSGWMDGEFVTLDGKNQNSATYVTRTLTVKEPRIVEAALGSDDGLRVWLNGRPLLANNASRAAAPDQERVRLWLRPGENRLLLKVVNGEGAHGFYFRLLPEAVTAAKVDLAAAAADFETKDNPVKGVLDDKADTGWSVGTNQTTAHLAFFRSHETFGFRGGTELRVRLVFGSGKDESLLRRLRLSAVLSPTLTEFIDLPPAVRTSLLAAGEHLSDTQRAELRKTYRERLVPEVKQAQQLLAAKRKERDDFRQSWPTAMVMRQASPTRETHVLIRGQYNNPGEKVQPGVPGRLFPWAEDLPRNRLGLAKWLIDPSHPLTSRVVVNQYWQKYFGTGLVKSSEDFGAQGEWPSHPALLDWLATEFVRTGWNVKAMQRLIVTSATYRQDSVVSKPLLERDPENRLLAHGSRLRLDAENIRDLAMSVSGLLNPKIGGPSVFPYQPPGLWGQVSFEGTGDYVQSKGAENYRRGLYTYWRRSIPYAGFTIFDAPSREVCTMRRPRTNTPLQALALMNDPVYVEAARALGYRVITRGGVGIDERIRYAFRLVLGREPSAREREVIAAARDREFKRFAQDRTAANQLIHVGAAEPPVDVDIAELAAWTVVANTLLNLDEAITKG